MYEPVAFNASLNTEENAPKEAISLDSIMRNDKTTKDHSDKITKSKINPTRSERKAHKKQALKHSNKQTKQITPFSMI